MLGGAIETPDFDPAVDKMRLMFLEKTAYSSSDLLAFNPATRIFYTRNGGLYRLPVSGDVEHLKGPSPDPEDRL